MSLKTLLLSITTICNVVRADNACIKGLPKSLSLWEEDSIPNGTIAFVNNQFTCNGIITHVSVGYEVVDGGYHNNETGVHFELRRVAQNGSFDVVQSIPLLIEQAWNETDDRDRYILNNYELSDTIQFQENDYISIFTPVNSTVKILVDVNSTNTSRYFVCTIDQISCINYSGAMQVKITTSSCTVGIASTSLSEEDKTVEIITREGKIQGHVFFPQDPSPVSLYLQLWRDDDPWTLVWQIGLNFTADYSTCNNTQCVVNYWLPNDLQVMTKKGDFFGFFTFHNFENIVKFYAKGSQTPYLTLNSDCIHREIPREKENVFIYGDSFPLISFDFDFAVKKNGVPIQATAWSKFCQTHEDTDYLPILIATVVALLSCFLITALIVLAVMYCKIRMKAYDAMASSELLTTYHRMQDSYSFRHYYRLQSVDEMKRCQESATTKSTHFCGSYLAINEGYDPNEVPFRTPCTDLDEISTQLSNFGISPTSVELGKEIGSGQFGTVFHGVWNHDDQVEQVAVKMLHDGATKMDRIKLLKEAAIIEQFSHANIVKLCGVVINEDPVMILLEYLSKGNLSNFLISIRPKEGEPVGQHIPQMLLGFARDVGCGMNYLSNKCFIHRDLAARNILLTENNVCKVADFCMSRDLENDHYYVTQGGFVPFKWTAPEALLYRTYTTASDVWSYGILLYEMWSLGQKPYEDHDNTEVLDKLESGYRLPPPPGCPRHIYRVMIQCWNPEHKLRPTFSNVLRVISQPSYVLFHWFEEDKQAAGSKCDVIGAPIEAGHSLYPDLQNIYR
ncbi:uncharacterized protein [Dysidea avara]|uniref:uncharacterized protein isoform X3 n=1 Tax=Dysidea avara TaxID=196820 RepID=UPI003332190B